MQRRFIKIDSAENLYNETELALGVVSLTWDDIYYIKVNSELVSVENFRTITESIDFSPFEKNAKIRQIIIVFNNGSQMIRKTDKNFRICYCFYDVTKEEMSQEDIEKEYGENFVKITLVPNMFEYSKDGTDEKVLYFSKGEEININPSQYVKPDFKALKEILKNKSNYKRVNTPILASSKKQISMDSLSQEELDEIETKGMRKFGGSNPDSIHEHEHYEDDEGTADIYEDYEPGDYYIDGDEISVSGSDNFSTSTTEEVVGSREIDYFTIEETYYEVTTQTMSSSCSITPTNPVDPNNCGGQKIARGGSFSLVITTVSRSGPHTRIVPKK